MLDDNFKHPIKDWLFDAKEGPWADASQRFADATVGPVTTITPNADASRVFAQTELPALLNNTNITEVDGIPMDEIKAIETSKGPDAVRDLITDNAYVRAQITGLSTDPESITRYLESASSSFDYEQALSNPSALNDLTESLKDLSTNDPERFAQIKESFRHMAEVGGDLIESGANLANKLGPVGVAVGLTIASTQASAAYSYSKIICHIPCARRTVHQQYNDVVF